MTIDLTPHSRAERLAGPAAVPVPAGGAAGRGGIQRPISVFLPSSLVFRPGEQERATEAVAVDIGGGIHACRILRVEWVVDVKCCEYRHCV